MASVNSNYGAAIALQNLNSTNRDLESVQSRISTGLKIGSARDNGAVFAIAEGQRGRVSALASVRDGIDRGNTVIDTALAAGKSIGTVLQELRKKAVDAQQSDLSAGQKATLQRDFDALRSQINQIANAATFNGANLVNGTNSGVGKGYSVLTSDIGGSSAAGGSFSTKGAALSSTDITSGNQVLADISGLDAGDTVTFTFGYDDPALPDPTAQITINAGETVQQFTDRVNTATNGRITASFDAATGRIGYASTETFRITTAVASGDAKASAFLGANRSANTSDSPYSVTSSAALPSVYTRISDANHVTGGAAVVGTTGGTTDVGYGFEAGDIFTFRDASGATIGTITLAAQTVDSFLASIDAATNGAITATRDTTTGAITLNSNSDFTVTLTDADAGGEVTGTELGQFIGSSTVAPASIKGESTVLAANTTGLGLANGDAVTFRDSLGNQIGSAVSITGSTTVKDFIDAVNTNTNGRVKAQLNDDGTLTYRGDQAFEVSYVETATTSNLNANQGSFLAGSALNQTYRLEGTAFATTSVTTSTNLDGVDGLTALDQIAVLDADGQQIGAALTIVASTPTSATEVQTLGQLLTAIETQTGGAVQATYDTVNRKIIYTSNSGFRLDFTNGGAADATGAAAGGEIVGNAATGDVGVAGKASASAYGALTGGTTNGNGTGAASVSIDGFDFRTTGGGALSSLAGLDVQTNASAAVAAIDTAITTLNDGLAKLGSQARALDIQKDFLQVLSDNVEKGIGALVDADLAKESARLQSLQIKQQLGVQALSIANQAPQVILSLFRG